MLKRLRIMLVKVCNVWNQEVGEVNLNDSIFALKPRIDIIKLVIDWQRAKSRLGTHKVKTVSEVSGSTRKPFRQKGTGNARQGSLRSVHMRGGGVSHGPVVRSHKTNLPKKVRKLGLKHALSSKFLDERLFILDSLSVDHFKTSSMIQVLKHFPGKSFFIIDSDKKLEFSLVIRNIKNAVISPVIGVNVYDIIKHDCVLLLKDAVQVLEKRLG